MKIVIADDSRVMRQIVLRTMRQAGYAGFDVVEACDGADALEKIDQHGPDLVLSDWNMPNMTGLDLLRRLRSAGNQVPFGFVTSEGSAEMRSTAEQAGAEFLLAKPFSAESFRDVLEPLIGSAL